MERAVHCGSIGAKYSGGDYSGFPHADGFVIQIRSGFVANIHLTTEEYRLYVAFCYIQSSMAQSIRISDDLYSMAQNVSLALGRPLAQQMEYWARLGAALDAAGISTNMAMDLLGNGVRADKFIAVALGRVAADNGGGLPMLRERQRKDAEEVAAGLRDPRSLLVVGKGDLKGARFTGNPNSEFSGFGDAW